MLWRQIKREYKRERRRISHAKYESRREYYRKIDEKRHLEEKARIEKEKQELQKMQEESKPGGCLSSIFWLFIFVCFIIYLFQSCGNLL